MKMLKHDNRRGSALLIVLGFLSFLIISAVSFSVMMRVERQAASNFRHASSSRHLLNTALVRAMDEIDSELRIHIYQDGTLAPTKFPTNWTGRVRCSAVANGDDNANNADVLSLEALAYVPPALVNDVRRFARPNEDDEDESGQRFENDVETDPLTGRSSLVCAGVENWRGAKWRPIYQALNSLGGDNNANGKPQIGRYAYVCVNLSDFLNVNCFRADAWDALTNRVSIGSLFNAKADAQKFDEHVEKDLGYQTLPDFYAQMANYYGMSDRNGNRFFSPWFSWWFSNSSSDAKPDQYFGTRSFLPSNQVFVADGIVKAEPRFESASVKSRNLNEDKIWKKTMKLGAKNAPNPGEKKASEFELDADFFTTLKETISADDRIDGKTDDLQHMYGAMLADYFDEDSRPRVLAAPSMERTCQINRIVTHEDEYLQATFKYEEVDKQKDGRVHRKWTISFSADSRAWPFDVQVFYPYHDHSSQNGCDMDTLKLCGKFKAALDGNVVKPYDISVLSNAKSGLGAKSGSNSQTCFLFENVCDAAPREYGYHVIRGRTNGSIFNSKDLQDIEWLDSSKWYMTGKTPLKDEIPTVYVAFNVCAFLLEGSLNSCSVETEKYQKLIVDAVPFASEYLDAGKKDGWITKLKTSATGKDISVGSFGFWPACDGCTGGAVQFDPQDFASSKSCTKKLKWEYGEYECPDPRFNYRLDNWVMKAGRDRLADGTSAATAGAMLAAGFLGKDGRDGDADSVGCDIGDASPLFISPAELAFLPRPYSNEGTLKKCNEPRKPGEKCYNEESFFRTIRLYDQGTSHRRDNLYRYFYCANATGVLRGGRVNPLSDNPMILGLALGRIPTSYAEARRGQSAQLFYDAASGGKTGGSSKKGGSSSGTIFSKTDWERVANAWFSAMQKARTSELGKHNVGASAGSNLTILNSLKYNLSDIYGSMGDNLFNWYTAASGSLEPNKLFAGSTDCEVTLSTSLSEAQRKMFYSWTLDNFSDRQQLFLYILAAEAVVPSIGNTTDTGAKSVAGGRAVALVWRDPYPEGYSKKLSSGNQVDVGYKSVADLYRGPGNSKKTTDECLHRTSPWYQYSLNNGRGQSTASTIYSGRKHDDLSSNSNERYHSELDRVLGGNNGEAGAYHQQRVLFFHILDD